MVMPFNMDDGGQIQAGLLRRVQISRNALCDSKHGVVRGDAVEQGDFRGKIAGAACGGARPGAAAENDRGA